ncbi:MAG TPA: hypothetical protein VHY35_06395 [Stellaceae bacterium]|jgi:hypothetical protein|nr:hypothetical protein [Stellaceae bacterium]
MKLPTQILTGLQNVVSGIQTYISQIQTASQSQYALAQTASQPQATISAPQPAQVAPSPNPDDLERPWVSGPVARHNVRAICDLEGLTLAQKEDVTACVYVESQFTLNATHLNYAVDEVTGHRYLASTDYGIVQVNDYWHIGPGKDFPSAEYVLNNPEACVRWMCRYYKIHGNLNAWVSWTSGAYKAYLGKV